MQMDEGLDTGAMLDKTTCPITAQDTAQTLHDKLATLGAEAIVKVLAQLANGKITGAVQETSLATYASKLSKAEAQLDWTQSAVYLQRTVRAYNPVPVAYSMLNMTTIKIWQANVADVSNEQAIPGEIIAINKRGIVVACGAGALCLEILQKPNGKALTAVQFLQGFLIKVGDRFTTII